MKGACVLLLVAAVSGCCGLSDLELAAFKAREYENKNTGLQVRFVCCFFLWL